MCQKSSLFLAGGKISSARMTAVMVKCQAGNYLYQTMDSKQKEKPEIIVLTQFGKRDRDAADKALELARKTGAELHLLHCFSQNGKHTNSDEYGRSLEQIITREAKRLQSTIPKNTVPEIDIETSVIAGELSESVFEFTQGRNVQMVVMGGRPSIDDCDYFCTDVNDVIRKMSCPVLVVPQEAFNPK